MRVGAIFGFCKPAGKIDAFLHELFIILAFFAFTAVLTWPYVNYLRDAVADTGDPYLVSWILWWDYHQTFTDPLNLFQANVFYPYRYTLAFSEHCFGIALLFFPLFALGLRPLTVHAVAMFVGFVGCGYSAFRLTRTLSGSEGPAWVAGIIFAFVPFRFHLLSHLPYFFSLWIPLVFEALILFVRRRTWNRAVWLGCAFFLNGLTSVSMFALALVPFAFSVAILLTRHGLWRERQFWWRSVVALGLAALALLPFMLPYYVASKLYGFKRSIEEVKANSAWPIHWLSVENRNKLWNGMGTSIPEGYRFKLFPGLLPLLLSLVAVLPNEPLKNGAIGEQALRTRWLKRLDLIIVLSFVISILAVGFDRTDYFYSFFKYVTSERALAALTVATIARLCIAYPALLRRGENANLIDTLRSKRRGDAFCLAVMWTIVGFCYSLGWNFFFYRICYDLLPIFRSMRVPIRGAIFAYLGLAILAGLGVQRVAQHVGKRQRPVRPVTAFAVACFLLLFELNAAPLKMVRGDVFPDAVTLRLKDTPMRGGIVVLPTGPEFNHRYMLRAADHMRPLIVGTSGFNSPYEDQIEGATRAGPISDQFLDLLEAIPASYVVVKNDLVAQERRQDYEIFFAGAVESRRLRFINRFDGRDDLYAVVRIEPQARTEAPMPFALVVKEWKALIEEDPVHILGPYRSWTQSLYRFYIASYGRMPRYAEFLPDVHLISQGVLVGLPHEEPKLESKLREFANGWVKRREFQELYKTMSNESYVDVLAAKAGLKLEVAERAAIIDKLNTGKITRAQVLLEIVKYPEFARTQDNRSLVLLHYFGYLRRNPDDPPDKNLTGFDHWVKELESSGDTTRLSRAFMEAIEYKQRVKE